MRRKISAILVTVLIMLMVMPMGLLRQCLRCRKWKR